MEELWLMHGDVRVAKISVDPQGSIKSIVKIESTDHMPPGTLTDGWETTVRLNEWWSKRAIPASRWKLYQRIKEIGTETPESLMIKSMGISLSDNYWTAPVGEHTEWSDMNHYQNEFSDDVGDLFFGRINTGCISFNSPDSTLNGNLKKRWKIIDGNRILIKGGSGVARQEPFNEVIASMIMSKLGISHVEYDVRIMGREPYSLCRCFSSPEKEFVPSWGLIRSTERKEGETLYEYTLRAHSDFGLDDAEGFFERMIVVDYLLANEDRHFGNFGIMRDPVSLDPIGFAPIFDSGSSLGFNQPTVWIRDGYDLGCMPFKITHRDQIRLVSSFDWLDLDSLDGIGDEVRDIFGIEGTTVDCDRSAAISDYLERRISSLSSFMDSHLPRLDDPRTDLVISTK